MAEQLPELFLARHGETAWTISRQHTGKSDIPLTARGEQNARALSARLVGIGFDAILTSPLARARTTAQLAGFGQTVQVEPDLIEWDYGHYDGLTTAEIRADQPDWDLFRDGCPGGESPQAVTLRADRLIDRLRSAGGRTLLFGHGHFFRVLAVRWVNLSVDHARSLILSTASLSVLAYEHSLAEPAIRLWNDDRHVLP
jgi:broad specificity phosphatase PhoE